MPVKIFGMYDKTTKFTPTFGCECSKVTEESLDE